MALMPDFVQRRLKINQYRQDVTADVLKKRNGLDPKGMAVEVGCNLGLGIMSLKGFGMRLGLDLFLHDVKQAAEFSRMFEKEDFCSFAAANAVRLPLRDESAAFVFSHHVIEHMPVACWEGYLLEMHRALRKGGVCLLSVPSFWWPWEGHYHLPMLHWLPRCARSFYARLTPIKRYRRQADTTYKSEKGALIFTEFPRIQPIRNLLKAHYTSVEDVTREFLEHPLTARRYSPLTRKIASAALKIGMFPERKFLAVK